MKETIEKIFKALEDAKLKPEYPEGRDDIIVLNKQHLIKVKEL